MKVSIKWYMLALTMIVAGCSLQAQILRPIEPAQGSGGGIWLSVPGITGEGLGIHNGETQILSMEDSVANTVSQASGGAGVGKIVFGDLRFRKAANASSLPFITAACNGSFLPSLKFVYYQKNAVMLSMTLSDVIVTKYRIFSSDCSGNNCPGLYEEISLSFKQMQYADNAGHSTQAAVTSHF